MQHLPGYIPFTFVLTTILTTFLCYRIIKKADDANTQKKAGPIISGMAVWLLLQAALTLNNVYNTDNESMPPKIVLLGILPVILLIISLFVTRPGRQFMDNLPLPMITGMSIIRIPVELVLFWLFLNGAVPRIMTFEGWNFDILAGITAPVIAYFGFAKNKLNRSVILVWNFICLALLLNIVIIAFLSAPSPLQRFAFDQPNIAILNFPFSWLPTFIVPIVLLGHLISIRRLLK